MSLSCLVITQDHFSDLQATKKTIESIEEISEHCHVTDKILSIDLTANSRIAVDTFQSLCDWAEFLGWNVVCGVCEHQTPLLDALMRGLAEVKEDVLFCCDNRNSLRRIPTKFVLTPLFKTYNVGWLNYDYLTVDLEFCRYFTNWIKINNDEFILVNPKEQNKLALPAIATTVTFQALASYVSRNLRNCDLVQGLTKASLELSYLTDKSIVTLVQPKTQRELPFHNYPDLARRSCLEFKGIR